MRAGPRPFRDYQACADPRTQSLATGTLAPRQQGDRRLGRHAGRTEIQRRKEEASDYRYFPEPDLVPVTVDAARLERVRAELGELPAGPEDSPAIAIRLARV